MMFTCRIDVRDDHLIRGGKRSCQGRKRMLCSRIRMRFINRPKPGSGVKFFGPIKREINSGRMMGIMINDLNADDLAYEFKATLLTFSSSALAKICALAFMPTTNFLKTEMSSFLVLKKSK